MTIRASGRRKRGLLVAGAAVAVLGLAGCAARGPRLRVEAGLPWPTFCHVLERGWGELNTFESELRFSLDSELANLSGWGEIAYSKAGVLVLQLRGPLGVRAADVVATGDSLWIYVPFRNTLYVGSPREFHLSPLAQTRWLEVLFGRPVLECDSSGVWQPRGENWLIAKQNGPYSSRRYLVDRKRGAVREAQFSWGRGQTVVVHYEGTARLGGCLIARLVRLTSEDPKARVAIAYHNLRVNRRIDWKRYRARFPDSARRVPLKSVIGVTVSVNSQSAQGD